MKTIIIPKIIGLGCQIAPLIDSVEMIAQRFGTTVENIQSKSGISNLYHHLNMVDATVKTTLRVLEHTHVDLKQITGVFGSSNPTGKTLVPTFTVQVATHLGLKNIIADHIGIGCCGGVQALRNAYNQVMVDAYQGKISYCLVIAADETNNILDKNKFATSILFSEGCGVLLVTNDGNIYPNAYEIQHIHTKSLLTDQESVEAIRLKNPFYYRGSLSMSDINIEMNGAAIYKFGTTILDHIMECADISLSEFTEQKMYLIPHQPNLRMLHAIMHNYNLHDRQIYIDGIKTIGNTSVPAVFFGLHDALTRGLYDINNNVVLGAFGAELQVGGVSLKPIGNAKSIIV